MLLTPYGLREWGAATVVAVVLGAVFALLGWWWALVPVGILWLAVVLFFRDPIRRLPAGLAPGAMISPADGVISAVEHADHHDAVGGPAMIVRIFLSVLDVHVNRAPCDGVVVSTVHRPGKYHDARMPESAAENESQLTTLRCDDGRVLGIRQISGKIARRIVCPVAPGDRLGRGQRFGMIKFGSGTELILPRPDAVEVHVRVGDKVRGGRTIVATVPRPSTP